MILRYQYEHPSIVRSFFNPISDHTHCTAANKCIIFEQQTVFVCFMFHVHVSTYLLECRPLELFVLYVDENILMLCNASIIV